MGLFDNLIYFFSFSFWVIVVLDRFSKCGTTVKYSGKKVERFVGIQESNHRRGSREECDVFSGKWVYDNTSHPLYNELGCPYMSDQLACHKHGRPDLGYQHWRWQPHNCDLKRYYVFGDFITKALVDC